MILRIAIALSIICLLYTNAQRSFAATKFELSPELPWEDPVEVQEANDEKPVKIQKQPKKHREISQVKAVPTVSVATPAPVQEPAPLAAAEAQHVASPSAPAAPQPAAPIVPPGFTYPALTPYGQQGFGQAAGQQAGFIQPGFVQPAQPAFSQPPQPAFGQSPQQAFGQPPQPAFAQPTQPAFGQPAQPAFVQPAQPVAPAFAQPAFTQPQIQAAGVAQAATGPANFPSPQQPRQISSVPDSVQLVRAQTTRERVELWFRDDYPDNICKRDARDLAEQFKQKFPANLWKNGKEQVLTDLLTARLGDCIQKQDSDHWTKVNGLIHKLNVPLSEEEECRSGLIQEQISCSNVLSYTCQFIQKPYIFRLVPARIIIQEARIAEDGAEKCRKIVRKVKKELQ
ncbi:unnamed protein product [Bursaphelenchus okinawaensis]|uniref:Uncharacterized protein n=1 Tax=Bursaphelenchus okinawaensis TaxID=465554 RepID=A0A811KPM8_9BILA|nr:unnamed protein product [Bursaphelenchus okinawaensis]CAG9108099.1 unnamed protein product [Bursaphelenchus okinawaensis]